MTIFEMTDNFERLQPAPVYKKGVRSRALVASDGRGVICIDRIGPHLDYWFDEVGESEHDAFEGAPVGISIWEGKMHTSRDYWGEYDCELVGDFRPLTDDEWEDYKTNGGAWDSSEWFEEAAKEANNEQDSQS